MSMLLSDIIARFPPESTKGMTEPLLQNRISFLTHRSENLRSDSAFVLFKELAHDNKVDKHVIFSKLSSNYPHQLFYNDLESVSQNISIELHRDLLNKMNFIAVTGTNGKSSVVEFVRQWLNILNPNSQASSLGTLGLKIGDKLIDSRNTTPFPLDLYYLIRQAFQMGSRTVVLEASSHGLEENRLKGLEFDVIAFTNLSHDHLDYHSNLEAYAEAKKKLFHFSKGSAVINGDCPLISTFQKETTPSFIYATQGNPNLHGHLLKRDERGMDCSFTFKNMERKVFLPWIGEHNLSNILCSMSIMLELGYEYEELCETLAKLSTPKGRLESMPCHAKGDVYIDYAHTPQALELALKSLRLHRPKSRLKVLFGCGGNRDPLKRPMMGEISSRLADAVILTNDNPRWESEEAILKDIEAGMKKSVHVTVIQDRREAIEYALKEQRDGDVLLLAGKGHECYQEIKGVRKEFKEWDICENFK